MDNSFLDLYTQIYKGSDRRQQNLPVDVDNRKSQVPVLDSKIQKDLTGIKKDVFEFIPKANELISQVNKYGDLTKKKETDKNQDLVLNLLSPIPFLRRFTGVKQAFESDDDFKGYGKLALLINFFLEDGRDVKAAGKQIRNKVMGIAPEIPKEFQVPFSYTRGTLAAKLINKMGSLGDRIYKSDITLYHCEFAKKLLKQLGLTKIELMETTIKDIKGNFVDAIKLEGKLFAVWLGRAMQRTPIHAIIILSVLELSAIYKAFAKPDEAKDKAINGSKQILKSIVNVSSLIILSGLLGALGASKAGATGSLIGLGAGAYASTKVSNQIGKLIDAA